MWVLSEQWKKNMMTHRLRVEHVSIEWAIEKKNMMTHRLRVEDVSIEWAIEKKKHDDAQAKSRRCEYWVSSWKNTMTHRLRVGKMSVWILQLAMICQGTYTSVNADVTNKFKISFVDLKQLCAVIPSNIDLVFTLQSPVTIRAISK